jgi:hypothetical protein
MKKIRKIMRSKKFKRIITRINVMIMQIIPLTNLIIDCVC